MSNFKETFKKGQQGLSRGIPFGSGLERATIDINGVQQKKMYIVAGPEKSGKSTFTDYAFVIQPYLYAIKHNINIEWRYYSYEIDRVSKEFDFACYFLYHDYGINEIKLPDGVLKDGKNTIELNPSYLKGHFIDDSDNFIKVNDDIIEKLQVVIKDRIEPLFGIYAANGVRIQKGMMTVKERAENPTGLYKDILELAAEKGTVHVNNYKTPVSYKPKDESAFTIVILDHIRKLKPERGWKMKETIDKMGEYIVILRNLLGFTFVPIIHTNRNLSSINRLNFFKKDLYPTPEDIKDSGNLGEDCDYMFTTFNPNDDKYSIKEHFNLKIRDSKGNILYPTLRTIHLVSSRHCEFPRHYKTSMLGNVKSFETLK